MKKKLSCAIGVVSALLFYGSIAASAGLHEGASPYFDWPEHNAFIRYQIESGRMRMPFVLQQPYRVNEIRQGMSLTSTAPAWQRYWLRLLARDLARFALPDSLQDNRGRAVIGGNGAYRMMMDKDKQWTQYRMELEGTYVQPYFVLSHKIASDQFFKSDPHYFGDRTEWIMGRVEKGYAVAQYRGVGLYAGRLNRNWGIPGEKGFLMSDNPYSYDTFGLFAAGPRFRFSFYTTRLNDAMGYDIQAIDQTPQLTNRYFSIKRFEWSPRDNMQLAFAEAAVYGGVGATFETLYLNPMGLVYIEQRNNVKQMNGSWSMDFFWKPARWITLYGQFLIDDIIVNNEPGQDDRAQHPDRLGVMAKVVVSDVGVGGSQVWLTYTRVDNWTYMSYRNYENYVFYDMSLGYPKNSVENMTVGLNYFAAPPFIFQNRVGYERHGDQDMSAPFGDTRSAFPIGVVEESVLTGWEVSWLPSIHYSARLEANYASVRNADHVVDKKVDRFLVRLSLFARYHLSRLF